MKLFLIHCSTGCSCCHEYNHYRGPYESREAAQRRVDFFLDEKVRNNPVASQFAPKGYYHISEHEAEKIKHGRIIVSNRVFPFSGFIPVDENGKIPFDDWFLGDEFL